MKRILTLLGLLSLVVWPLAANAQRVETAEIVGPKMPDVQAKGPIGSVVVHLQGGQTLELSRTQRASDVKIAPDHRTVAWTEGQIIRYSFSTPEQQRSNQYIPETRVYVAKRIIVWRDGKRATSIVPKKLFTVNWQFYNNGQQIAVASAGSMGAPYYQLFDTYRARRLAYLDNNDTRKPAWVRGIDTY